MVHKTSLEDVIWLLPFSWRLSLGDDILHATRTVLPIDRGLLVVLSSGNGTWTARDLNDLDTFDHRPAVFRIFQLTTCASWHGYTPLQRRYIIPLIEYCGLTIPSIPLSWWE